VKQEDKIRGAGCLSVSPSIEKAVKIVFSQSGEIMKINIERSKVHDTIKYFELFFNYKRLEKIIEAYNLSSSKSFEFYNAINENEKISISKNSYAFFKLEENRISLLCTIFYAHAESIYSLDDFIKVISDKKNLFEQLTYYYLDGYAVAQKHEICEEDIYDLECDDNKVLVSLTRIVVDFEEFFKQFKEEFLNVYEKISKLFGSQSELIANFKIEKHEKRKLEDMYKNDLEEEISLSLINPYSIRFYTSSNCATWFIGYMFNEYLNKEEVVSWVNYEVIANLFSNKLALEILDIIKKNKKISPADIVKILDYHVSEPTIYRVIANLSMENALSLVERRGRSVFYSINEDFFFNAALVMNREILYYCNNDLGERGDLK